METRLQPPPSPRLAGPADPEGVCDERSALTPEHRHSSSQCYKNVTNVTLGKDSNRNATQDGGNVEPIAKARRLKMRERSISRQLRKKAVRALPVMHVDSKNCPKCAGPSVTDEN